MLDLNKPKNRLDPNGISEVLTEIYLERTRQHEKFGDPQLDPRDLYVILMEEVGEVARAMIDNDPEAYRAELVQVAAVCVQMIQAYDRSLLDGN